MKRSVKFHQLRYFGLHLIKVYRREAGNMREIKKLKKSNGVYSIDIDISAEEWMQMLINDSIFYEEALDMIKKWYSMPNYEATHKEVMQKFSLKSAPFNGIVQGLSKRIIEHLNRFEIQQNKGSGNSFWCMPFEGWDAEKSRSGVFVWKLRRELVQAIDELKLFWDNKRNGKMDYLVAELESYLDSFKLFSKENSNFLSRAQVNELLNKFQEKFKKEELEELTFEQYALGTDKKEDSYSYWLEYETRPLGSIKGGSAEKHGVWFSKDEKTFKAASKFKGENEELSMKLLKEALLNLLEDGTQQNYDAIEENALANTVKYKTLYMYYPKMYLPMFSNEHYIYLLNELGYLSENYKGIGNKQKILLEIKQKGLKLRDLTNYEYIKFLYYLFGTPRRLKGNSKEFWIEGGILKEDGEIASKFSLKTSYEIQEFNPKILKESESKGETRIQAFKRDYEKLQKTNIATGLKGEKLVVEYEYDRLKGYPDLQKKIEHKSRDDDGLGYDILSFEIDGSERHIEVKTTKGKRTNKLSFHLTANELQVANNLENYWIYDVSEIDSICPKIIPIEDPFSRKNEEYIDMKPTQYFVNIGIKD